MISMATDEAEEYLKAYKVYFRGNPEDLKKLFDEGQPLNTLQSSLSNHIKSLKELQSFGEKEFEKKPIKEELKEAVNYVRSNLNRITQTAKFSDFEFHLKATDLNGIGNTKGLELAMFLSIVSSIAERPLIPQLAILGSMSIGGAIIGSDNLGEYLQVSADSGAKKVLIPAVDVAQLGKVPSDLISKFSLLIYSDPVDAAFKAMGLE